MNRYAGQINEPLLLLHHLDATNVGTHPIQSQRAFGAPNGLGKTDRHVKQASGGSAAVPEGATAR